MCLPSLVLRVLTRWWSSEEHTCISFNGGKDCTAVLHLLVQALPQTFRTVRLVFFRHEDEFDEIIEFVDSIVARHQFDLHAIHGPMQAGLVQFCRQVPHAAIYSAYVC